MLKKISLWLILFPIASLAQCFECAKNFGGWTDDIVRGMTDGKDGILYQGPEGLTKYDYYCNQQWNKSFQFMENSGFSNATCDENGNIYQLINTGADQITTSSGFFLKKGLNLAKISSDGTILWTRHVGYGNEYYRNEVFYCNNEIFVISPYNTESIIINDEIELTGNNFQFPNIFLAKYTIDGDLTAALQFDSEETEFNTFEVDNQGNIYLAGHTTDNTFLKKADSNFELIWSKTLTNGAGDNGLLRITTLHYNPFNDKIYLWGGYLNSVNYLGNNFTPSVGGYYATAGLLAEHNTASGDLENIQKFDNSSSIALPGASNGIGVYFYSSRTHIDSQGDQLFVLSSFSGSLQFSNGVVTSGTTSGYNDEDLVLFKVNLADFQASSLFTSHNVNDNLPATIDTPGPLVIHDNAVFVSSSFQSNPMYINESTINNNSGNNNMDAMLYKFMLDGLNTTNNIIVENTCPGAVTNLNIEGAFDNVVWDFGDPASGNNTATGNAVQHQFSGNGTFTISVTVYCSGNQQTVQNEITIAPPPTISAVSPLYACEDIPGSGISSSFDTSQIESTLNSGQENITYKYYTQDGTALNSPLENPYTNTTTNGDLITVRAYYNDNPYCFTQTTLQFIVNPSPVVNPVPDLHACEDIAGSGISSSFNTANIEQILLGSQNNVAVTFYDSTGNMLPNLQSSNTGTQVITARLTSNLTGCYTEGTFALIVDPKPVLNPNIVVYGCDADNDGMSSTFDTSNLTTLLADNTASNLNFSYYNSSGAFLFNDFPVDYQNSTPYSELITAHVADNLTGCYSEMVFELKTSGMPIVQSTTLYACDEGEGHASFDLSLLDSILVTNPEIYNITYFDSNGDQILNTSSPYQNTIPYQENLSVIISDVNNPACNAATQVSLVVQELPIVNINDDYYYCSEDDYIIIDAGNAYTSYEWRNSEDIIIGSSQNITIHQPGHYTLYVTQNSNNINCLHYKSFTVNIYDPPTIIKVNINNDTAEIMAEGNNLLYSVDGINFQESNYFTGLNGGIHTVYVVDPRGCGYDKQNIHIITYPLFFTPNNDRENDNWQLEGIYYMPGSHTYIYDQYGKLLLSIGNNLGWDGKYNGQNMPATDYWFRTLLNDGRIISGHFSLIR